MDNNLTFVNKQFNKIKLGQILVLEGIITVEELQEALAYQRMFGSKLGICLLQLGYITRNQLNVILSLQDIIIKLKKIKEEEGDEKGRFSTS